MLVKDIWKCSLYDCYNLTTLLFPEKKSWLPLTVFHNQTRWTLGLGSWEFSFLISNFGSPKNQNWQCWCSFVISSNVLHEHFLKNEKKKMSEEKIQSNFRMFIGEKQKITHLPHKKWSSWERIPTPKFRTDLTLCSWSGVDFNNTKYLLSWLLTMSTVTKQYLKYVSGL